MLIKDTTRSFVHTPSSLILDKVWLRIRPELWHMVALVSFFAGVGSGWQVLIFGAELLSPLAAAATMMLATFGGWYAWSFFTYLADNALFGGHSDYRGTLNAFGVAYLYQAICFFTFVRPLGWVWGWVAFYITVAAWGIIGPRRLGMRTWQAIVAATLGMLLWLACLLVLTLVLVVDGMYVGIGAFLA